MLLGVSQVHIHDCVYSHQTSVQHRKSHAAPDCGGTQSYLESLRDFLPDWYLALR